MPLAAQIRTEITELETLRRELGPHNEQFVVLLNEQAYAISFVSRRPTSAKAVSLPEATRLLEVDAQMVARALASQAGKPFRAVALLAALQAELTRRQSRLRQLEDAISVIQWLPKKP
ncbi:hypothetical protein [Chitinibacter tainanensis]|uniref:hypothetical protein n=1 Tax=Chitinibacter tainanensis TaxID=230667 RepID=UPI0004160CDD|nr:hypothetical protein [Chitinibacter tainanensis]